MDRARATLGGRDGPRADSRWGLDCRRRGRRVRLIALVAVALFFDFTNGFHDTANAIATSVSTRAVSPPPLACSCSDPQLRRRLRFLRGRGDRGEGIVEADFITPEVVLADSRRDHMGSHHVVLRPSDELEPRAHRRNRRLAIGQRRGRLTERWLSSQGSHPVAGRPGARHRRRGRSHARLWIIRKQAPGVSTASSGASSSCRRLRRVHARNQRRAEDDGHHRPRSRRHRPPVRGLRPAAHLGDRERPRRRWGLGTYAGGWESFAHSVSASPSLTRRRDSRRRLRRPRSPGSPRTTASRSRRPPSRARARRQRRVEACTRCAGVAGNILLAWVMTMPPPLAIGAGMEVLDTPAHAR